jgi:hypothetical protein
MITFYTFLFSLICIKGPLTTQISNNECGLHLDGCPLYKLWWQRSHTGVWRDAFFELSLVSEGLSVLVRTWFRPGPTVDVVRKKERFVSGRVSRNDMVVVKQGFCHRCIKHPERTHVNSLAAKLP